MENIRVWWYQASDFIKSERDNLITNGPSGENSTAGVFSTMDSQRFLILMMEAAGDRRSRKKSLSIKFIS